MYFSSVLTKFALSPREKKTFKPHQTGAKLTLQSRDFQIRLAVAKCQPAKTDFNIKFVFAHTF
jgi:hypothetical protein